MERCSMLLYNMSFDYIYANAKPISLNNGFYQCVICEKYACFPRYTIPKLCFEHGKCNKCNRGASYNFPGEKPKFCKTHASEDMIYIYKTCNKCNTRASYGVPDFHPDECAKHRSPCTISQPNSKCRINKCNNKALYGTNMKRKRCETHKYRTDDFYIETKCTNCGLMYFLNKKKLCEYCDPTSISFEIKHLYDQINLFKYLDERSSLLKESVISTDKTIQKGICGKERPDRVYESNKFMLILECDEDQHKSIVRFCEEVRMKNISQMFGGMPTYFIRWNPDVFVDYLHEEKDVDINDRYICVGNLLENILTFKIDLPKEGLCYVTYLYYDGWKSEEHVEWKCLLPFEK